MKEAVRAQVTATLTKVLNALVLHADLAMRVSAGPMSE